MKYTKEEIITLINQFKEEQLPDRNESYSYEAEISVGLDSFIEWLKIK